MGPLRPHRPSDQVAGYLARNERIVLEMKQHWARVLPAVASCLLGLVLVIAAGLMAPAWMGMLTNAAWWIWLVLLIHLGWRVLEWWDETFVITNKRLILVRGLIFKKVAMMPLSKVTDMSYNRSPAARLLGYGTFVMESAGQEQALNVIDFVRDPDARYRDICGLIFGFEDEDEPRYEHHDGGADRGFDRADEDFDTYANDADNDGWDDRWQVTQPLPRTGSRPYDVDQTDPYGLITVEPGSYLGEGGHPYADSRDVGEGSDATDDDSAWSVSREHATTPQTIRRSRRTDTRSTWRDAE